MAQKHVTVKEHVWAAWDEARPEPARTTRATSQATHEPKVIVSAGEPSPLEPALRLVAPGSGSAPRPPETAPAASSVAPPAASSSEAAAAYTGASPAAFTGEAESIRRELALAWGEIGSAWGVPPATARVHGYLLAHRRALTEREIRLALGLSHRAASLALADSAAWGLVGRVPEVRRAGRRGPAGTAWVAVGDHWRWFGRVVEQRRLREGDPAVAAIARAAAVAREATERAPDDAELADLRAWLDGFLDFVRLFDRVASLVARVPPADLERAMRVLGEVPDEEALRMLALLAAASDQDLRPLVRVLGRLSPAVASPAARLVVRVLNGLAR